MRTWVTVWGLWLALPSTKKQHSAAGYWFGCSFVGEILPGLISVFFSFFSYRNRISGFLAFFPNSLLILQMWLLIHHLIWKFFFAFLTEGWCETECSSEPQWTSSVKTDLCNLGARMLKTARNSSPLCVHAPLKCDSAFLAKGKAPFPHPHPQARLDLWLALIRGSENRHEAVLDKGFLRTHNSYQALFQGDYECSGRSLEPRNPPTIGI